MIRGLSSCIVTFFSRVKIKQKKFQGQRVFIVAYNILEQHNLQRMEQYNIMAETRDDRKPGRKRRICFG